MESPECSSNASSYEKFQSWPWHDYLWTPSNHKYADIQAGQCALHWDRPPFNVDCSPLLMDCFIWTVLALLLRACLHCLIALPIAHLCGVYNPQETSSDKHKSIFLMSCRDYIDGTITVRSRPYKFADCAWRWAFYVLIWIYAYSYLSDPSASGTNDLWIFDFAHLWHQYPEHPVTAPMRTHYILEVAYYCAAMLTCMKNDRHRKDFVINMVHHSVTLLLLYLSWTGNMVRAGTLVLLIHDAADGFIEMGKMVRYATTTDVYTNIIFGIFIIVWCITRLGVFPCMIWSGLVDAQLIIASTMFPFFPALLLILLSILQVLHVIWTILIFNIVKKALQPGGHTIDARSDSENSDDEEEMEEGIQ